MEATAHIELPEDFFEKLNRQIEHIVLNTLSQNQPQQPTLPEYYNLGAAAAAASISRGTLRKWITKGLPVVIVGNAQRIKRTDLEAFMDNNKL